MRSVSELREARATEARTMLLCFGIRPVIQDRREARLARTEQLKNVLASEAHTVAHSASIALRHLVSVLFLPYRPPDLNLSMKSV